MPAASARTTDEVVDTGRYPLEDPDGPVLRGVVERARRELASTGCSVLTDVVRPE
ncbi:MAG: arpA protein, partial [Actinobacteria bacterium]|nr:arpA protein [Actinomycetota bacterium]